MPPKRRHTSETPIEALVGRFVTLKLKSGISRKFYIVDLSTTRREYPVYIAETRRGQQFEVPVDDVVRVTFHDTEDQAKLRRVRRAMESLQQSVIPPEQLERLDLYRGVVEIAKELEEKGVQVFDWRSEG